MVMKCFRSGKEGDKEWVPVTKLGRLVKDRKITSLEEIYLNSLPIKVCIAGSSQIFG